MTTVDAETLGFGLNRAIERFEQARFSESHQPIFASLFEFLNWTASIDEWLGEHRTDWAAARSRSDTLLGVRYARNRVQHQWADAMKLDGSGGQFPLTFPITFYEWRWREESELPPPPREHENPKGEAAYEATLAGEPIRLTIQPLIGLFAPYLGVDLGPAPESV